MAVEIRDKITSFALTPTEKFNLQYVCNAKGVRMSDYIRDAVMKQLKKDSK